MRDAIVESFRKRWEHVDAMTRSFAEAVPEAHWESTPHEGFAPFCKQLRHVVCVRGVYNEALRGGRVDFTRKHEHYRGTLSRRDLLDGLGAGYDDLLGLLSDAPDDLHRPRIDFFGHRISWLDHLYGCVQHEAIHHGQWSLYAARAGYETPAIWRLQWGLGAGAA